MRPESNVENPKPLARGAGVRRHGAWCVVRGKGARAVSHITHRASRFTLHVSRRNRQSLIANRQPPVANSRNKGFTLIEIMIVVGIMGIVMAMSVPIVYKVWRKAPMTQAVKDIVEVLSHARARAIMQGHYVDVIIHPKENRLELAGAGSPPSPEAKPGGEVPLAAAGTSGSGLSAHLAKEVIIETLDVNMSGIEYNDVDQVRIRFYPNGISDEMKLILFDGKDRMGIDLEITTGLANVVPDPLRAWSRR